MKEIWDKYGGYVIAFVIITFFVSMLFALGYATGYNKAKKESKFNYTSPVEKSTIDTLYVTKDRQHAKVKHLEITKNDTIETIYNLDDSATIDLFYKLVAKSKKR